MRLMLYVWRSEFLCQLYLLLTSQVKMEHSFNNKPLCRLFASILNAIRHCFVDKVRSTSVIAVGMYKLERYKDVVKVVDKIRTKLQNPNTMYIWTLDEDKYRAAGGENTSLITMMIKVVAWPVGLGINSDLSELALEHQESAKQIGTDFIVFPPLIISNFLLFLSQFHMRYHDKANEALSDLLIIVHYNDGHHIHDLAKAISWEILGICQEMMGDYQGAYQSYTTALQQPYNYFKAATEIRLQSLLYNVFYRTSQLFKRCI